MDCSSATFWGMLDWSTRVSVNDAWGCLAPILPGVWFCALSGCPFNMEKDIPGYLVPAKRMGT